MAPSSLHALNLLSYLSHTHTHTHVHTYTYTHTPNTRTHTHTPNTHTRTHIHIHTHTHTHTQETETSVDDYSRGVVFYLGPEDRRVVGVLTWNLFGKMDLARQVAIRVCVCVGQGEGQVPCRLTRHSKQTRSHCNIGIVL